jgi:hypothetical protein
MLREPQHGRKINDINSPPFVPSVNSGRALSIVEGFREGFSATCQRKRPVWNSFFCRIFAVVAVIFLLLCNTAQPNENIVVAYSGVSGFQGPLWTFSELKLFPKYNLNPAIVLIAGGTQSMQALLSNYTHFALASALKK